MHKKRIILVLIIIASIIATTLVVEAEPAGYRLYFPVVRIPGRMREHE